MATAAVAGEIEDNRQEEAKQELIYPPVENGRFVNPFRIALSDLKLSSVFRFIFKEKNYRNIPSKAELDRVHPVLKPSPSQIERPPTNGLQAVWIGHGSVLVQLDGITVLTDPIFSRRCAPSQLIGPARYREPALMVPELPNIDVVVISHTHYDHLDHGSVKALNQRFGESLRWYVPMGVKKWMQETGCKNVVELSWWEESVLTKDGEGTGAGHKFVFTPANHWSKRTPTDTNKALWGSWVIKGPQHSFYFAGDTGYCNVFKVIGEKYGPFTLAAIPIGAYAPRWFMKNSHINPEEGVQIHEDVKAEKSLGIHWGTFPLSYEFYLEPPEKVKEELKRKELPEKSFFTTHIGELTTIS